MLILLVLSIPFALSRAPQTTLQSHAATLRQSPILRKAMFRNYRQISLTTEPRDTLRSVSRDSTVGPSYVGDDKVAFNAPIRYSSRDWRKNLVSLLMLDSYILKQISGHLTFNIIVALSATVWHHFSPTTFFKLGNAPHTFVGAALSLLLVFRTNAAYDRFWEARKKFGNVVDSCRDIARLVPVIFPKPQASEIRNLLIAFPYLLRLHLKGWQKNITEAEPGLAKLLTNQQIQILDNSNRRPLACLNMLSTASARLQSGAKIDYVDRIVLDKNIGYLIAAMGGCERIQKCPVPLAYSRHTSRFLTIWSMTLPFVLVPLLKWAAVPVVGLICWSLFAVEEIGHSIEEPFNMESSELKMKSLCKVIEQDVNEAYALVSDDQKA